MGSLFKGLAALTIVACLLGGGALYVLANHSATTHEFICSGDVRTAGEQGTENTSPDRAFVVLEEYRWWVHLWAEADANMKVQLDKTPFATYVSRVKKIGDGFLAQYIFWNHAQTEFLGAMRMANHEFALKLFPNTTFVGTCQKRS